MSHYSGVTVLVRFLLFIVFVCLFVCLYLSCLSVCFAVCMSYLSVFVHNLVLYLRFEGGGVIEQFTREGGVGGWGGVINRD